ncbi:MAG: response regulator [Legionella sp. 40-6]|nr:response regulator [Legionella sp.]OJY43410.1 MAG: response regulator [Legionella sp. 40-6]
MSPHRARPNKQIEIISHLYMEIINAMPNIVYWIDKECRLQGCNKKFQKLLGLNKLKDFDGTPYDKMLNFGRWPEKIVDEFKLDDMNALFTKEAVFDKQAPAITLKQKTHHFLVQRTPMHNLEKEVIGLIVILTEKNLDLKTVEISNSLSEPQHVKIPTESKNQLPNVLMVEDNIIAQQVEKSLLTSLNCTVDIAATADDAINIFQPGKYDLVLMDIGLEDSSGYLVAKKIRQKESSTKHHVPIIALTGYEAEIIKDDCQHYFMEGAITKPLTSEQAQQLIQHFIYRMDVSVNGLKRN